MKLIPDAHQKVPMMFRAQVNERSQLQYLDPDKRPGKPKAGRPQDVELWVNEWIDKAELISAEQAQDVQTPTYGAKSYQIGWRFVTNGGQDDGILRPVIGASGIPFYPGSSMKGAFRQACQQMEQDQQVPMGTCNNYCGNEDDLSPGLLRFLGAYPTNDWTKGLFDLVHPQQGWQVKTLDTKAKPKGESAYAQVSLYQPTLRFAISSPKSLSTEQWQQIWQIWERALASGLGSKVSTGYGQSGKTSNPVIYRVKLKGQGQAAKLIDSSGEFRHNIFRAALRGHALRIFGGLTDCQTAENLVEELFGGIQGQEPRVGLLGFQFQESKLEIQPFGKGKYTQPAYQVEGELICFLTYPLVSYAEKAAELEVMLKKLVAKLMQFAMLVGGFGKSWRRVDHRIFFDEYYEDDYKALIGCHWQWSGENTQRRNVQVNRLDKVGEFFETVQQIARGWIQAQQKPLRETDWAEDWREAWHTSNVQLWGRVAENRDDSVAVRWFHQPYRSEIQGFQAEASIYESPLTGRIGQISRIWHRMYPLVLFKKDPENPQKPIVKPTPRYLELITLFPDNSEEDKNFLEFLETHPSGFEQLWGDK
jgi:CRISPR-associated protein Cmr6